MPTIHLLHGLPGAGKTRYARTIERQLPAVRFTHDEWMVRLHGPNPAEAMFRTWADQITGLIWIHAARVLAVDRDVILDFGFWTRASRDEARARASSLGIATTLHWVDCPVDLMLRRVLARNTSLLEDGLLIDEPAFRIFAAQHEPPGADEPHIRIDGRD